MLVAFPERNSVVRDTVIALIGARYAFSWALVVLVVGECLRAVTSFARLLLLLRQEGPAWTGRCEHTSGFDNKDARTLTLSVMQRMQSRPRNTARETASGTRMR